MGWKGVAAGLFVGKMFGGALGALLGAVLGHHVEENVASENAKSRRRRYAKGATEESRQREKMFCMSAAAILAKMAKADGRVTADEIACVERVFARLGFSADVRRYAIEVFRRAKDDDHNIFEYAYEFAEAVPSLEVRELFYELLWDLARADGTVSPIEDNILRHITDPLGIGSRWYEFMSADRSRARANARRGRGTGTGSGANRARTRTADPTLEAYRTLGVSPTASNDEVKSAYRQLAKKYHPDLLRAQGLPEELLGKATERMSQVNAAWERVKGARGMKG